MPHNTEAVEAFLQYFHSIYTDYDAYASHFDEDPRKVTIPEGLSAFHHDDREASVVEDRDYIPSSIHPSTSKYIPCCD